MTGYLLISGILFVTSWTAFAESVVVGDPVYSGSGCSKTNAILTLGSTNANGLLTTFKFNFSQLVASFQYPRACEISLPMKLPAGWQMAVTLVEHNGWAYLDETSRGLITMSYVVLPSQMMMGFQNVIPGPYEGTYSQLGFVDPGSPTWSKCGGDVTLQIEANVRVWSPQNSTNGEGGNRQEDRLTELVTNRIAHELSWRRCP